MPENGERDGQKPVAERNHVFPRVQYNSADEIILRKIPKRLHTLKIGGNDPLRSLDLDTGNQTVRTFQNEIHLLVVGSTKVKKIRPRIGEKKQLAKLGGDEVSTARP